ncbi:hypothetical protein EKK58_05035 [Candidatus Dependentiae bacterium]|nr:MAG: hypothetical protein EKK58_05035 [Candidatus Dependentiae bacterium]
MQINNVEAIEQQSILDSVKEKVSLQNFFEKVQDSRALILDIAIYGGIGFLIGYLLKRYINAVITMIMMSTMLFVLQQFSLITITIHWEIIYEILGITQLMHLIGESVHLFIFEWAKANVFLVISWMVGLLVGIKLG